jgi:hypothetical protein
MGEAGRRKAEQAFGLERLVAETLAATACVLARRPTELHAAMLPCFAGGVGR